MAVKFGVCPHDTEKDYEKWKKLAKALEEELGERVELITFEDFEEEKRRLDEADFDLYYASPDTALGLHSRGYIPVGRILGESDFVYLIRSPFQDKKPFVKLAVANLYHLYLTLDFIRSFSGGSINLIHTKDHRETYELVKKGKADYGLIYSKSLPDNYEEDGIEVLGSQNVRSFHLFMAKAGKAERIKGALLKLLEDFEPVGSEAIGLIFNLKANIDRILSEWENSDIASAVLKAPHVGVIIYQETIVYANDYACDLLGYTRDELSKMPVYELVAEEHRNNVKAIMKKRLKGEGEDRFYIELKVVRKDGRHLWLLVFTKTIVYRGRFSGFVLFVDITQSRKVQALYNLLREVNQIITTSLFEEELFEKICSTLVKQAWLRFVWVGKADESGEVKPISWCGHEEGYLQRIRITLNSTVSEGMGPTATALREGRIVINPDTKSNPSMGPWREEMLRRGYLSSCSVPIQTEGKTMYTLNLYADEPYFFDEDMREVLEEVKRDIEFALARMQEVRKGLVMKRALEASDNWTLITDGEGNILYVNDAVARISGYDKEELTGRKPSVFKSGLHSEEFYRELWDTILSGREFSSIFINRRKDGSLFHLEQTIMPVKLPGGVLRFVAVGKDITQEISMKDEIERLRFYDPLTGLLNFTGLSFKVMELIKSTDKYGALVLIDIHGMTFVNGTFGFDVGDRLLKMIADRLLEHFREGDVIARIGGDEFCVFAFPLKKKEDALAISEKLKDIFSEPFSLNGETFTVGVNAGVSLFPDDGSSFSELYNKAYLALSLAKEKGAGEIEFFNKELERRAETFVRTESLLETAVRKRLFLFYFQPYYRVNGMELAGVELLVRIRDEEGEVHGPTEFIDYLERSRFLRYFEEWSLEEIERIMEKFGLNISFNVSARSFSNDAYIEKLCKMLSRHRGRATLELTERILVEDVSRTKEVLGKLRKDAKIAVDDFGTGYSSLSYIKDLPVDIIKIDRSFVRSMMESKRDRVLVETVIDFTEKLGLESHAEGVESEEQLQLLKDMGCTYAQGFYLAKPMPEEELENLLEG